MTLRPKLFHPAWLLLFLLAGFIINTGSAPLFDVDEGAFSEATREMMDSGVWAATYVNGAPRYDKPILTYWAQAASVSLVGLNEWGLRLHSMIAAVLWGLALFWFTRQWVDRKSASTALLIFSSTFLISFIGRAATADALLNLFIALTMFDIYRYAQSRSRTHLLRTWLWLSLGMLTKGPVAALIPLLASGIWFVSYKRHRDWLRAIFHPVGWLILVAILTPWLYFVWRDQGFGFFQGFIVEHNLNRFAKTKEGHGGELYYYLIVLPLILLPYSGMLSLVLMRFKALWQRPLERLMLIWFVVVFILVSVSSTQLPHYMLYGVTPLLVLFAKYRRLYRRQHWQWLLVALFWALPVALITLSGRLAGMQHNAYMQQMLAQAPEYFDTRFTVITLVAIAVVAALAFSRMQLWQKLVLAGLVQSLFMYQMLMPAIAGLQQVPVKEAALMARKIDKPFVSEGIHMPSFSVYRQAQTPRQPAQPGDYVFTRADHLPSLYKRFSKPAVDILYQRGGIVLAKIDANAHPESKDAQTN